MYPMIVNEMPINGDAKPSIRMGKDWFRFFANLWTSAVRGSTDAVTTFTGASPLTYAAIARGQAIVSGGTVSAIALSRDGTTFYTTGQTAGVFPMSFGDKLKVTFTVTPTTLVFMPL